MPHHHLLTPEAELQVAERLVGEAETDIDRQKRIVVELRRDGRTAVGATILLGLFERLLKEYRHARDALKAKRGGLYP